MKARAVAIKANSISEDIARGFRIMQINRIEQAERAHGHTVLSQPMPAMREWASRRGLLDASGAIRDIDAERKAEERRKRDMHDCIADACEGAL